MIQLKEFVLGALVFFPGATLVAQKVCAETAVYFDSGKYNLTPQATHRLDSLIAVWADAEVHLELEGHTDSIRPADYNQKLSEDRVAAVKSYLDQHAKARLTIQVYAQSEFQPVSDNGFELGKAQNRRVEIKFVRLKDGNLTIHGQAGSTMRLPASAITECSICKTNFSIGYFSTDTEIAAAGIGMQTVDGARLTTGGMLNPQMRCASGSAKPTAFPACFTFPITRSDPGFSAWVSNEDGLWEPTSDFSLDGDTVRICVHDFRWDHCKPNWDNKKTNVLCAVKDSSGLRILR